jgi:DNA (cytosine-5)-methyltransferase 1
MDFETETFLVQPVLAFSAKDYGNDVQVELAPTLRAGGHTTSHANAGVMPAIAFNARQDPDAWTERTGPLDTDGCTQAIAFQDRFRGDDGRGYDRAPPVCQERTGTLETVKPWNVASNMSVRRLTPRECERLQGLPDDYTLIQFGKAIRPEKIALDWIKYLTRGGRMTFEECVRAAADGPRYKAIGNSMAVLCMRWIGERIAAATSPA